MYLVGALLRVSAVLLTVTKVGGGGCTNIPTYSHPVINMCERGNWILGRVFISITTNNMGSNTRCNCTFRARTPGLQTSTTFNLRNVESNVSRCKDSSIRITSPDLIDFTCASRNDSIFHTGQTTNDFMILLSRADVLVGVSYCLFMLPDITQANDLELICSSDQQHITITPATTTTFSTSTSSTQSSTSSSPSSPSVPLTSSAPAVPTILTTMLNSRSEVSADSTVSVNGSDRTQDFPAGAVVGGVMGSIALIGLILGMFVYIRCRSQARPPGSHDPGADNPAYDALSDVTRDNLRADPNYAVIQSERSSSQPGGNDAINTANVYESVDGASSATLPHTYVNNNTDRDTQTYYNV